MKLGKLKRISDLRSVWPHEAKDFTKWLAQDDNLAKLSEAVGVEIVLEERESSVGSFSVDLYALEEGSERKIIIENQLEDTNHDHLGKLITYASGKGAELLIWVVKRARDEHRQAVSWLNQHTDNNIGFFLIEIELWQIDDSLVAPKFNVVERPNDWAKQMKSSEGLSETKQLQLNFWQQLSDIIKSNENYAKEFTPRKAQPQHWYDLSVGSSSYHVGLTVNTQKKRLGAEIYIPDDKDKFIMFKNSADKIEELVGAKVEWREASKATRIITLHSCDITDESKWDQAFEWLLNKAIVFKKVAKQFDK